MVDFIKNNRFMTSFAFGLLTLVFTLYALSELTYALDVLEEYERQLDHSILIDLILFLQGLALLFLLIGVLSFVILDKKSAKKECMSMIVWTLLANIITSISAMYLMREYADGYIIDSIIYIAIATGFLYYKEQIIKTFFTENK